MGLQISVPTQFGFSLDYWRISATSEDFTTNRLHVQFSGYNLKVSRQNGSAPVAVLSVSMDSVLEDGSSGPYCPDMTRAQIYAYLKTLEPWKSAIDA